MWGRGEERGKSGEERGMKGERREGQMEEGREGMFLDSGFTHPWYVKYPNYFPDNQLTEVVW